MHEDTHARGRAVPSERSEREPRDPHIGRVLEGRYRIGDRIARGGMAAVYEAHDLRLDRTVAVKIMHAGLGDATSGDEAFAARFVREARAAARLSHPNVVSVYDQGGDHTADGVVYLVMELVPGHTLRDTIAKEAPMSPERALALLDPVLSALASAHRAGLIHRDVKPENVLIADDGRVKVADFGLARAVGADTQHTATQGVLIGTVSYLAPELVTDGIADARADVYAVGVILFELLTGTKPHTGETPIQVAYRHVHHDVPAPSTLVPGIPEYVDALVARATTRDRSQRPADAGVLLHHVHRVIQALHDGVRDDPDLVADLRPSATRTDTTPEPLSDLREPVAAVPAPVREERTEVIDTAPPATQDRTPARPTPARTPVAQPVAQPAPTGRPRRSRRPVVLLLLLALVLGSVAGAGYWYGWGRYTTAPSVTGLEQAAAETELEKAGLEVDYADPEYSERVEEGHVLSADPGSGGRILPDGTVTLTLSLGPERYDVPQLDGLSLGDAESALAERRLVVGKVTEKWSETVADDHIIRSDPAFGSKQALGLPVDSVVNLVVSKGRRPIEVGDYAGKDADQITEKLTDRGLVVTVESEEYSETVDEGDIISHDPVDATLHKGDEVRLVVSKGPPLVEIPSVFYESTDDAVDKLEDLGLKVEIEHAPVYFDGSRAYSTSPGAGEKVAKGSTVTIYVV